MKRSAQPGHSPRPARATGRSAPGAHGHGRCSDAPAPTSPAQRPVGARRATQAWTLPLRACLKRMAGCIARVRLSMRGVERSVAAAQARTMQVQAMDLRDARFYRSDRAINRPVGTLNSSHGTTRPEHGVIDPEHGVVDPEHGPIHPQHGMTGVAHESARAPGVALPLGHADPDGRPASSAVARGATVVAARSAKRQRRGSTCGAAATATVAWRRCSLRHQKRSPALQPHQRRSRAAVSRDLAVVPCDGTDEGGSTTRSALIAMRKAPFLPHRHDAIGLTGCRPPIRAPQTLATRGLPALEFSLPEFLKGIKTDLCGARLVQLGSLSPNS